MQKNDFRKQLEGILGRETASTENGDSSSDSKIDTSGLSTSDGEDSRYTTCVTLEEKVESKRSSASMEDVDRIEVESAVSVQ